MLKLSKIFIVGLLLLGVGGCKSCKSSDLERRREFAIKFLREHRASDIEYLKAIEQSTLESLEELELVRAYSIEPDIVDENYFYIDFFGDNPDCDQILLDIGNEKLLWDFDAAYTQENRRMSEFTILYRYLLKYEADNSKYNILLKPEVKDFKVTLLNDGKPVSNSLKIKRSKDFNFTELKNESDIEVSISQKDDAPIIKIKSSGVSYTYKNSSLISKSLTSEPIIIDIDFDGQLDCYFSGAVGNESGVLIVIKKDTDDNFRILEIGMQYNETLNFEQDEIAKESSFTLVSDDNKTRKFIVCKNGILNPQGTKLKSQLINPD